MNEKVTIGLYQDIIVTNDDKYLCFSRLESNDHFILNVPKEYYSIAGNTVTLFPKCEIKGEEFTKLVDSRFAYRLLRTPEIIPESKVHSYNNVSVEVLNALKSRFYTLTFVIDDIGTLPELHYPSICNNVHKFTGDILDHNRVKAVLNSFRYVNRIRLLSSDIFSSGILTLKELMSRDLEVIVNQSYYLNHLDRLSCLPNGSKLIVYLDDFAQVDKIIQSCSSEVNVSFFCGIKTFEDYRKYEVLNTNITFFPSSCAPVKLLHQMLDYSLHDLLTRTINRYELLLKSSINPLFFGNIVVDNKGNLNTYPYVENENGGLDDIGFFLREFKNNYFWNTRRPDYFNKCNNCALVGLCPPLSSFEINHRQTFCRLT